ncbi:SDR family NAD(P)-dependent oxidoreductase [Paenibacillus graminis]|uniref:SDR family NAD(P)-dependent oxidoreductase n=1 Tax=Paenibacillus graminis TaxID=189425 RepID=UPI002DB7FFC3|nr:SDR family NAD(P)-dependent oxidoreductase [Paenibacillus graminis]MEC0168784.1 SDR family NAD(P)-dependent oxidoreductase [Paenibacillus graminis]
MKENTRTGLEVAIIGMSGSFPGAKNLEQFFQNVKNGVDSISFFTDEQLEEAGVPAEVYTKENFVKAKGYLDECEYFDNSFFGYTPNEAQFMDPQTRLLHEHTWMALEDAGYPPGRTQDTIGVYAGGRPHFHWEALSLSMGSRNGAEDFEIAHLNDKDLMSTRVSYKLNLKGPSYTLFTACSTSLVAVHAACQGVISGECDMAVAGGVSVTSPLKNGYFYQDGMILSSDGHCRAFDAASDGTVVGNGIGLVILKRLEDALDDKDHIYAVIKGTAINNDGNRKVGYSAPSVDGQAEVIRTAHRVAGVDPGEIGYIEAHGTGTALGDPIEVKALTTAFHTNRKHFCGIGSVKTNIGHLDSAAGIAGLIKAVLALHHKCLLPTLHFADPNPHLMLEDSPFYLVDRMREWESGSGLRRAGVSSFGVGGTNAHIVLEEAPSEQSVRPEEEQEQLLVFSAKTKEALEEFIEAFVQDVLKHPGKDLSDIAFTLQQGREHFSYRQYVACKALLAGCAALKVKAPQALWVDPKKALKPVYFWFAGMEPKEAIQHYHACLRNPYCREEMEALLLQASGMSGAAREGFLGDGNEDAAGQTPVFLFQLALARWLLRAGVKPAALMGTGTGAYVAGCLAGVFTLEEALMLIEKRDRLLEEWRGSEGDLFLLEALQSEFYEAFDSVALSAPSIPLLFADARRNTVNDVTLPDYWVNPLGAEDDGTSLPAKVEEEDKRLVLDFGTGGEPSGPSGHISLVTGEPNLLDAVGCIWANGYPLNWDELAKHHNPSRLTLPTYPFARKRYWVDSQQIKQFQHNWKRQDPQTGKKSKEEWLYVPSWIRSEHIPEAGERQQGLFAVFAAPEPFAARCMEQLEQMGHTLARIEPGESFKSNKMSFEINPEILDDFIQLLDTLAQRGDGPIRIVHFWCMHPQAAAHEQLQEAEEYNRLGYYTLLNIARAVGQLQLRQPVTIDIVANQVAEVIGNETVVPAKATLFGPLRVIAKEYENIICRLVDTDQYDHHLLCRILSEPEENRRADWIALRNSYIWEPTFKQVRPTTPLNTVSRRLTAGGVYVITGGLGGIGLYVAKFLAEQYQARVVLLNRSQFLPEEEWDKWYTIHSGDDPVSAKIAGLREIKAAASGFCLVQADITDTAQVRAVFGQILERYGAINGIIHAAGVPDGAVIQRRSKEMCEAVFGSKIYGTQVLQKVIEELSCPVDFLLLFSSLSALLAPPAQVAYSAANSFLDAFALVNTRRGYFTQAINWDMWKNTGMASLSAHSRPAGSAPGITYRSEEHPLFKYSLTENTGRTTFLSYFHTGRDWVLDEHRIVGQAVLPGTCYLEMARAAYQSATSNPEAAVLIHDVFFLTPLAAAENTDIPVRTVIIRDTEGYRFTIESYSEAPKGRWVLHARGRMGASNLKPQNYELDVIRNACEHSRYGREHYNNRRDSKFRYGPRWDSYRWGGFSQQEGLSWIELPQTFAGDLAAYGLHPAILDVALVHMGLAHTGAGQYVPFGYRNITVHGKMPGRVYSYIRHRTEHSLGDKILEFDLTIMDEHGKGIIEIEGYQVTAVTNEQVSGGGAAAEKTTAVQAAAAASDGNSGSLTPEEGLMILDTALSAAYPQVIVSTVDLLTRVEAYRSEKVSLYQDSSGSSAGDKVRASGVNLSVQELEDVIHSIWKSVLGHEQISRDDDFFDLGGDSLKVLTVAERIYQAISIKIPVSVFFHTTVLKELARHIQAAYHTTNEYAAIQKAATKAHYPLSSAQKRLYFHQQLQPDSVAYNILEVTSVEGDLDPDKLQNAFDLLIRRHAVLRTSFDIINGEIVQIIHDHAGFQVEQVTVKEEEAGQVVEQFMQPFDLRSAPLLRVKLVRCGMQKYVWLFDIHHIIADNLSVEILKSELIRIYNGQAGQLKPIPLEYVDFVGWQNEQIRRGAFDKQTGYWLQQLSGELPENHLPTDYPRPAVLSHQGDIYTCTLEENVTRRLKQGMKRNTTTLFMNMMALYSVLLHKYTGQDEVMIGASLAGRNHADLVDMVGMFANVLPFRSRINREISFEQLLTEVKAQSLRIFENQDVQFEILVEALGRSHQLSENPLFNVMLVLPDVAPAEAAMDRVRLQAYPFRNPSSKFDLTLWVYDYDDRIEMRMEYSTDLFARRTITTMCRHLLDIAGQAAGNPDILVKEIRLDSGLVRTETLNLLDDGNDFAF